MGLSLKAERLKRYRDCAFLLYKYGRSDLARHAGLAELVPDDAPGHALRSLLSTAVEMKSFGAHLPGRVNRILDRLAENDFKVNIDAIDEATLMEGMQKVANRITTGLVLAALIVGAALMMRLPTTFTLFGRSGSSTRAPR